MRAIKLTQYSIIHALGLTNQSSKAVQILYLVIQQFGLTPRGLFVPLTADKLLSCNATIALWCALRSRTMHLLRLQVLRRFASTGPPLALLFNSLSCCLDTYVRDTKLLIHEICILLVSILHHSYANITQMVYLFWLAPLQVHHYLPYSCL